MALWKTASTAAGPASQPDRQGIENLENQMGELRSRLEQVEQTLLQQITALRNELAAQRPLAMPFGCPMPDGTTLVHTVHGNRFFIDPLDRVTGPEIIVHRQWEPDISRLLMSAADRDLVFVDVGANFGYFTCLLGSRIGRGGKGRIFSIEPNPTCVDLIRRNVEINWSMCPIEVCDCAVAAAAGTLKLYVPDHHSANGYLGDAHNRDWTNFPSYEVKVRTLDEIVPADVVVDLLKIDVEGHEHAVFAGAKRVLANSPRLRIVMEWSPGQIVRAGYSTDQMRQQFHELGLRPYRLSPSFAPEALQAAALSDDQLMSLAYDNIILTRGE